MANLKSKSVIKTNLYIFITPVILNDDFRKLNKISDEELKKMNEMRNRHKSKRKKKRR